MNKKTVLKPPLSGEVVIPSSIDDQAVTEIGENFAKGNKKITKVTIPSTIAKIDFSAFEDCTSLEKVVYLSQTSSETGEIVRDLTYGVDVFRGDTALKEAIVPARALNATSGTFAGCTSITSANIDGISQIDSEMFKDCTALKSVTLGSNVAKINDAAFAYSNLDSITLASRSLPYSVANHSFDGVKSGFKIYIPDDCKNTWTDLSFVSSKGWTQSMIDMMEVKTAA